MFLSAKDCGAISAPLNGTKRGEQTTYPSKVIFTCDDGFNLRGSNVRQCRSDGEWSGVETFCQGTQSLSKRILSRSRAFDLFFIVVILQFSFFAISIL